MANRTGTYFAFDGLGEANPTKSDFRFYSTVQGWNASNGVEFKFVNSHDKAGTVRNTSMLATLQASIRRRLLASKNIVVILSATTRKSGSLLSYEIEKAVDTYGLPLIVAYAGCEVVTEPGELADMWPNALRSRIVNKSAKAIHIPFKKTALFDAINRFTVNGERINGGALGYYDVQTHRTWGYLR